MSKRLQLDFGKPVVGHIDEEGQARPCAMGVGWVNEDTLATLKKRAIAPTDPKGRPLPDPAAVDSDS